MPHETLQLIPKTLQISNNDVTFLHDFFLKFHALTSVFKISGLYLAVTTNGTESRKISQLLHPTLAA